MQETELLVQYNSLLLFVLFFSAPISFSQIYPDKVIDEQLRKGINHVVNHEYAQAKFIFEKLEKGYPDLPLGKIYLAAFEITYSYDFELPYNSKKIINLLNEAELLSERLIEKDKNNKWNIYLFALTQGYKSYYQVLNESWFKAIETGLSSISAFEDCLENDPNFYEAWIAIGTYEYWKSRKTEMLSWIPFITDKKQFGIEKLNLAKDSSFYNKHIAIHSLIWIYIDQNKYQEAIELATQVLKKNPKSRIYKWGLARAYENIDARKSIAYYKEILKSYQNSGVKSNINEITLKHLIAQLYGRLGELADAKKLCLEIIRTNDLNEFEREKLDERLDRVKSFLNELPE